MCPPLLACGGIPRDDAAKDLYHSTTTYGNVAPFAAVADADEAAVDTVAAAAAADATVDICIYLRCVRAERTQ